MGGSVPVGKGGQSSPEGDLETGAAGDIKAARLPRLLFSLLLALVVLAPLPQGGREPWSAFLLVACVGALLAIGSAGALAGAISGSDDPFLGTSGLGTSELRVPFALFLGVCAWAAVQWMPWTPSALHHPLWTDAGRVLGEALTGRISLNPEQTLASLLRLLAYGGVFVLALGLGRDAARARRGLQVFVYAGFAYALYGLMAFFSGSELTLWFGERLTTAAVTSTFENRNSYATLAGMGLIAAIALFLDGLGRALRARVPARTKLRFTLLQVFGPGAPLLVAVVVLATALLLTASRGGTLSTLFGLLVLAGAFLRAGAFSIRQVSLLVGFIVLTGTLVFALSGERLADRLGRLDPALESRGAVYRVMLRAIGDAPLVGTGYGSFPDVFPLYRDASITHTARWQKAHNTYLENALELGVPAAAALCTAIAACARICWLGIRRRRRHRLYPMVGVAVTALVAAHAWVDFSLQIPAVSISYAFVLGIACAQSFPSRPEGPNPADGLP